jgi:hypothetical protein
VIFPREFKRTGAEQIDWKLMGFGAGVFVAAFLFIAIFASIEPPQISAEEIQRRAARVVSQLKMPDIPETPPPPKEEIPKEEEVQVAEEQPVIEAQPQERVRQRGGSSSGGGGGGAPSRGEGRARRGDARAAAAAALAQQGVWAQLSTGSTGAGAAVAAGFGGAGDLEANLGKVGGVKRGGVSTMGEGDGTGLGEGAIVGPGGGRSARGGEGGGMDVGSLLGGPGGGIGGGGASSLGGGGGGGPGGGVDIDVNAIADAGGGGGPRDDSRTGSAIQSVVRQNLGPIKFCYERELKLNPKLEGALRLKLTIAANGRVQAVEVVGDTIGNQNLSRCVQGRVRAWKFEPASGTSVVTITLPFSPNA